MAILVKICGLTRYEDAALAVSLGADLLGFVFAPSVRRVEAAAVATIITRLRETGDLARARTVGVFVDCPVAEIARIRDEAGFDLVQLHGDEQAAAYADAPFPWYRALRIAGNEDFNRYCPQGGREWAGDRLLVDAPLAAPRGGGPVPFAVACHARDRVRAAGKLFFLAGGLSPNNVGAAVSAVRPDGLDAASGLEAGPGIKDGEKLREFFHAIKEAEHA